MRPNRKRIVAAVVFAVTLVLGTTALVLAWRLNQEKKITEEEASAAETCSGYDWKCGSYSCPSGCQSECIPRGDCEAQQTQLCRCKVVEGGGTCTGKGCTGTGTCDQNGCSVSCKDNAGCDWNCADRNCGIIYVGTAVCKGGPLGNPEWPEAQGYTCKAEWCPSECKNDGNTCKSNSEAGRDDCEIVYSKPLGDGLNGRTPNPEDSKYWCTVTQVDSNGSNGAFTLMAIGDNGEYCYTVNSLNNWQCTNGHTNPDQLDWDCAPEPLTIAGNVYCSDDGGTTKYAITGTELVSLYMDGAKLTSTYNLVEKDLGGTDNKVGEFVISTKTKNGTDKIYPSDGGFDTSLLTLPNENLSTGQPYSSMIPADPKAVNCADDNGNDEQTGCTGGDSNGSFCGGTGSTNYSYCGLGAGDHTNFDFVYTNCTPTEEPAISCVSKVAKDEDGNDLSYLTAGKNVFYNVTYTITNTDLEKIVLTDKYTQGYIAGFMVPAALDPQTGEKLGGIDYTAQGGVFTCTITNTGAGASYLTEGTHTLIYRAEAVNGVEGNAVNYINTMTGTLADGSDIPTTSVTNVGSGSTCTDTVTIEGPNAGCESKTADKTTVNPGDTVQFTIKFHNDAADANASRPITITDTLPDGFTYVSATLPSSVTGSCTESNGTVTCRLTDVPANLTHAELKINTTVDSDVARGTTVSNTATVSINGDIDDTDNDCSVGTNVSAPEVACVSKVASPDYTETTPASPGDIVTYTVSYTVTRGPVTVNISEPIPDYLTILSTTEYPLPTGCSVANDTLTCTIVETNIGNYENELIFHAQIDTEIPLDGTEITNVITVKEDGEEPGDHGTCEETVPVEHTEPYCIATTPNVMTIRVADLAGSTVTLNTTGNIGTHTDLDFKWTTTCGTLSNTDWHTSSGTPSNGTVADSVTWTPPTDAGEGDTCDLKVYIRPEGSTDATGVSADTCESTATITALDLICNWLVPNDEYQYLPFDMTFAADIGGDQGAAFSYDLNFGDGSAHYTGTGTVASGTTVELPYVPPQAQPHTYDSTAPMNFAPSLIVTNTETGETSVCPTVLPALTQSEWSIVKDSDVDTCVAEDSTVTYTIVVTNTGDYTADLAQVRDTLDSKIDTTTLTNIRECDSNGANCTSYNKADVLDGRTITWPGRTFTAGESRRYVYTVTINSAGDYYNVAEAIPETGATVRDDEIFPTCEGKAPETGVMTTALIVTILGMVIVGAGTYAYKTEAGAQVVANVLGKTGRAIRRTTRRKESFERDAMKASKDKLKN